MIVDILYVRLVTGMIKIFKKLIEQTIFTPLNW